jgi:hypothetical protein
MSENIASVNNYSITERKLIKNTKKILSLDWNQVDKRTIASTTSVNLSLIKIKFENKFKDCFIKKGGWSIHLGCFQKSKTLFSN